MKHMYFKISLAVIIIVLIIIYLIPAPQANFFKLYKTDNTISKSLKKLQAKPTKKIMVDGVTWDYYTGGNGTKTILFLHGMGGAYDLWWQQIAAFEKDYKVISYTLPEKINSLKKASEGILAILKKEHVNKFYAVGTSMGGYITQYLVNLIPNRVEKAVFGNTFPPNTLIAQENATKSKVIPFLPEILISKLGEKKLNNELIPASKNSKLLKAFLPSLPFSKKQFMNRYSVVIDPFTANPTSYKIKRIPKLILESDNDPLIQPELRKKLKELYSDAKVYTFHNEGHFPYINASNEYNKVLRDFLNEKDEYLEVEKTIANYFEGRKNANITQLQSAFSNDAKLYTVKENTELIIPLKSYLDKVKTDGKQKVATQILDGDITGNIANFKTKFSYSKFSYTDYLSLLKINNQWKIISKTFTKTK
ncbi:alpha/beta fold hydrolase [Lutibacter sp.]|uniref:alpha/beta fold hydrolase n=1 Tax=Lutibacter sp. TaxID=1925666 RepID=UPI0025BFA6DE|nr:alpha/beta fold hydrolase [Lutibacter sp.]MCF6181483.1 alpha/beta fold hydrolase [Lutibacter sp.]